MKSIMILGANDGQMPFINICKEKGYRTIVVSPEGKYPGFKVADKCVYLDTRDKEAVLQAAIDEKIDGIVTDQTDVSVGTVAYVAEKLNLRGIGIKTALKFTDKYEMRKAARNVGVRVPEFDEADSLDKAIEVANRIGYPVMIKPVDSSGSRGVLKIINDEEMRTSFDYAKRFSNKRTVIVEKFIEGVEYLADGFAMNYEYVTLDVGVKEYFDVPNTYCSKMCMFFSGKLAEQDYILNKIRLANDKLAKGFDLQFGITHAEYMYCKDEDEVYLVEIAARGGGVYISSDITPNAAGFDTNRALINFVAEGTIDFPVDLDNKISGFVCFSFPDGEIIDISGVEDTENINGVDKVILNQIFVGMKTKKLKDDSGKFGPILFTGINKEECYDVISKIKSTLKISVMTDEGIRGVNW